MLPISTTAKTLRDDTDGTFNQMFKLWNLHCHYRRQFSLHSCRHEWKVLICSREASILEWRRLAQSLTDRLCGTPMRLNGLSTCKELRKHRLCILFIT